MIPGRHSPDLNSSTGVRGAPVLEFYPLRGRSLIILALLLEFVLLVMPLEVFVHRSSIGADPIAYRLVILLAVVAAGNGPILALIRPFRLTIYRNGLDIRGVGFLRWQDFEIKTKNLPADVKKRSVPDIDIFCLQEHKLSLAAITRAGLSAYAYKSPPAWSMLRVSPLTWTTNIERAVFIEMLEKTRKGLVVPTGQTVARRPGVERLFSDEKASVYGRLAGCAAILIGLYVICHFRMY